MRLYDMEVILSLLFLSLLLFLLVFFVFLGDIYYIKNSILIMKMKYLKDNKTEKNFKFILFRYNI